MNSEQVFRNSAGEPLHPYCNSCGWRKGGPDSWNGRACKCGHYEPPIRRIGMDAIRDAAAQASAK